jgi:hypothetical protein
MSQAEVDSLIGQPTAQTQHMTGKQWQPFNFGAKDLQRLYYLYKGVGRIEFSMKSGYEGVFRVIKVTPDPPKPDIRSHAGIRNWLAAAALAAVGLACGCTKFDNPIVAESGPALDAGLIGLWSCTDEVAAACRSTSPVTAMPAG